MQMASIFSDVELSPPIEVFALNKAFEVDTSKNKINLGIECNTFYTEVGEPWIFPVVKEAEKALVGDETLNKEYLPILGLDAFSSLATKMLLGDDSLALSEGRAFGVQTLSDTGALRVGAEFLARCIGYRTFYYSKPVCGDYKLVFSNAGFTDEREYRYWDEQKSMLDTDGLLEDLRNAPENSVIILHVCAHNPTGYDPTHETWKQIADVIEKKKLFPFFQSNYQGFASGDLIKDAWSVRYFASRGFELLCAQSLAGIFGLYDENVGNLIFVLNNVSHVTQVKSQITLIIRGMYSNPPSRGARIIAYILNNSRLYEQWKDNIRTIVSHLMEMRKTLKTAIEAQEISGNWEYLTAQIGIFFYSGFNTQQIKHLAKKHHIYILNSGKISMSAITQENVDYIANAIYEMLTNPS